MLDLGKQLKKGVLEILVLHQIAKTSQYGYSLMQELREKSSGFFDLKEGTLYPILYRLEDAQLIKSYWVEAEGRGIPKKYYRITEKGKQQAIDSSQLWESFSQAVNDILLVH